MGTVKLWQKGAGGAERRCGRYGHCEAIEENVAAEKALRRGGCRKDAAEDTAGGI